MFIVTLLTCGESGSPDSINHRGWHVRTDRDDPADAVEAYVRDDGHGRRGLFLALGMTPEQYEHALAIRQVVETGPFHITRPELRRLYRLPKTFVSEPSVQRR